MACCPRDDPPVIALRQLHRSVPRTVEQDGFSLIERVIEPQQIQELADALGTTSRAGRRGLLAMSSVAALARSGALLNLIRPHLPNEPIPVRTIFFDKSPSSNWLVAWHQDLTLAVRDRIELPGFGPWSTKDGIPHVQPPVERLAQMLTVRVHLDDTDESNGALRVLPGSHHHGRLSADQIRASRMNCEEVLCAVPAGGAMLMRPLLLHASSRSTSPGRRRILHIEYAGFRLPSALRWHESA